MPAFPKDVGASQIASFTAIAKVLKQHRGSLGGAVMFRLLGHYEGQIGTAIRRHMKPIRLQCSAERDGVLAVLDSCGIVDLRNTISG